MQSKEQGIARFFFSEHRRNHCDTYIMLLSWSINNRFYQRSQVYSFSSCRLSSAIRLISQRPQSGSWTETLKKAPLNQATNRQFWSAFVFRPTAMMIRVEWAKLKTIQTKWDFCSPRKVFQLSDNSGCFSNRLPQLLTYEDWQCLLHRYEAVETLRDRRQTSYFFSIDSVNTIA